MKKSARIALFLLASLTTSLLLISTSLAAGPYMNVQVGGTWLEDTDFEGVVDVEFDTGFNVGAAVGYDFGMTRLEAEVAYRQNDVDDIKTDDIFFFTPPLTGEDGDFSALSLMVNGYVDFETGSPFTPYLGAGLGVAKVSANDVEFEDNFFIYEVDDDDTVFAYQIGAGVAFAMNETISLDLGYRYFATEDPEFDDAEFEYNSHNASVGLRINF